MGKLMSIKSVETGMVLDMEIIDQKTGAVLVPEGITLTKSLIEKLKGNNVSSLIIREEEVPAALKNEGFTKEYSKMSEGLESVFEKAMQNGEIKTDEVMYQMEGFVSEVSKEADILTQMRLMKKTDDYTFNHSLGVSILALTLGKWLGYSEVQVQELAVAGIFHDIGKLRIPIDIVRKPGKLTEDEFDLMKKHSFYGYEMLQKTGEFSNGILLGVLQHHEKVDGTGYPNGVKADKIHDYGKILAICDIYHALTSNRVYKDKDSPLTVADYLKKESFISLDPYMTQVFLKNISKFYVGSKVLLSNGTTGLIRYIHPQDENKPIVQIGDKFLDFMKAQNVEILDILI
ncbi:MAG: HD-GYP domain-containing protein [Tissierellaceae bacterium]|nr:HD-GYP domain-containing protein [Tissierellaceae bacterium]